MFSHILEDVKLLGMQGAVCANEATVSPHAQVLLRIIESLAEHALPGPPVKCTFLILRLWQAHPWMRHAPEYLAMIFHEVRWADRNGNANVTWKTIRWI